MTRLLGLSVLLTLARLASAQHPIVNLGYVKVQGNSNDTTGVNSYLGIKYAAPPSGALRWQPPVSIETRNQYTPEQTIDATEPAPQCIQGLPAWGSTLAAIYGTTATAVPARSSEDCLSLDVFAPPESKDLPVQVWIHGGGYNTGSATGVGGENIVAHSNGTLIFVSIQYRLGAYGFLSNAAVKENGAPNTGLLDMRAALDWIQRNIHAFGGDASKVTISGGSAGGGAVTNQLILYGGEKNPPFRAAIPEYPWWQTYKTDAILDTQFRDLLIASNCTELDCLRNLSEKDLANATQATYQIAYESGNYAYGDFYYGPAVDGEIIRDLPSNEFKQGHFNKVALLTDHNGFEGAVFTNFSTTSTSQLMDNLQKLWPSADAAFWARLSMLYPATDFTGSYFDNDFFNSTVIASLASAFDLKVSNPQFWRAQDIYGDFVIDCPTYYIGSVFSNNGLPTYKLVFNAGAEVHGAISAFLQADPSSTTDPTLANQLQDYYISFVKTLDPNEGTYSGVTRPYWPQYLQGNGTGLIVMEVNQTSIGVRLDNDASARCDFFCSQSHIVRN